MKPRTKHVGFLLVTGLCVAAGVFLRVRKPLRPVATGSSQKTLVYVFAEGVARDHLSLYGYHRPTTRRLSQWGSQLFVHQNTVSSYTEPTRAFLQAMVAPGPKLPATNADALPGHLVSELRKKGVSIFSVPGAGRELDEVLQNPAEAKVISIRLGRIAFPYCTGAPMATEADLDASKGLGRKFFGDAPDFTRDVTCYDQLIAAMDSSLEEILNRVSRQPTPVSVLFFSSRGEAPELGTGHDSIRHSAHHIEVPHLWYFNGSAKSLVPEKILALSGNLNAPFDTSKLSTTILDLMDGGISAKFARSSLFSPTYEAKARRVPLDSHGRILAYDEPDQRDGKDYIELTRINLARLRGLGHKNFEKVWAHKVNSLGKLIEAKGQFAGVEMDVVFQGGEFRITHPPAKDIGLTLQEMLEVAKSHPKLKLWLDWKNPEPSYLEESLKELSRLDRLYAIKARTLIETPSHSVFPELREIGSAGYEHSFYLPSKEIIECSPTPKMPRCSQIARRLFKNLQTVGATTISFDWKGLPFITGQDALFEGFSLATWNEGVDASYYGFTERLPDLTRFTTYLAEFRSPFSR